MLIFMKTIISIKKETLNYSIRIACEPLLNPFITYPDIKNFDPNQVIDLGFRIDRVNLKEFHLKNTNTILITDMLMLDYLLF